LYIIQSFWLLRLIFPTSFLRLPSIENCEKLELLLTTSSSSSSSLYFCDPDFYYFSYFWLPPLCLLYSCRKSPRLASSLLLTWFLERSNSFLEEAFWLLFWLLLAWLLALKLDCWS
jgi:hypothetical protein